MFLFLFPILSHSQKDNISHEATTPVHVSSSCQPDDGEALQVLERAAAEYTRGERRGQIESRFHLGFSCPQMG